jgi:hypothetical protein
MPAGRLPSKPSLVPSNALQAGRKPNPPGPGWKYLLAQCGNKIHHSPPADSLADDGAMVGVQKYRDDTSVLGYGEYPFLILPRMQISSYHIIIEPHPRVASQLLILCL